MNSPSASVWARHGWFGSIKAIVPSRLTYHATTAYYFKQRTQHYRGAGMTQPQDQYRNLVQQSQESFQDAVGTWTKTVQDTMSSTGRPTAAPVDPQQVVGQVFDFAERMLAM